MSQIHVRICSQIFKLQVCRSESGAESAPEELGVLGRFVTFFVRSTSLEWDLFSRSLSCRVDVFFFFLILLINLMLFLPTSLLI